MERIDWDRVCLTSPVGPYAEPVAALAPVQLGVGRTPPVLVRRSHLRTFRVVEWKEGPPHTTTYAAIAEFTSQLHSSRPEVELTKFTTMPSQPDPRNFNEDGRVFYNNWSWTPEFFDAVSRLERRIAIRSLDILNDLANPGWLALKEAALGEIVPFAIKFPVREYVSLLIAALDRLVNFWARSLRLKWYLGEGHCSAMLDPLNIEYPRFHPINLDQIENIVAEFGNPTVIAASFAMSLKRPEMEARVREARQNGLLAELVPIENLHLTEHMEAAALGLGEVEVPVEYGDLSAILSGKLSSMDLIDRLPVSPALCDERTMAWLQEYAKDVIGLSADERRTRFDANFPEIGSYSRLDDIAGLSTLRYLRRCDFPSQYDWYAFVESEVFDHRFGAVALLDDLRRYVMGGLRQLASFGPVDFDRDSSEEALASLDSSQRELAACHKMADDTELLLQEVVVSLLKHKFGDDGLIWYDEGVPEKVQDRVEEKWIQGGKRPPEQCLDLLHYRTIMKANWDLFFDLFTEEDDPEPKVNKSIRWIGQLNQVRLDLAHPSRRGADWLRTETGRLAKDKLTGWLTIARTLHERCAGITEPKE